MLHVLGDQAAQTSWIANQRPVLLPVPGSRVTEFAIFVQHTGRSRRSSPRRTPVLPNTQQDDAAGHVFTAVVADAPQYGNRPGVTHAETPARAARRVQRRPPVAPYRQVLPIMLAL